MTTRSERQALSLSADQFRPHELDFEQLLVWARQFAQMIPYRDTAGQTTGHWGTLFEQNDLVVCAMIMSTDLSELRQQFKKSTQLGIQASVNFICQLYRLLEQWYTYLPNHPEMAYRLRLQLLSEYQTSLTTPFRQLLQGLPEKEKPAISEFDSLWQLDHAAKQQNKDPKLNRSVLQLIHHCFSQATLVISRLQNRCRQHVEHSLHHQEHSPQLALYISFLKLFERAQQQLNGFTRKHLLFYYQQILKQSHKTPSTDQVFLKLSQNPASQSAASIQAGDIFSPGVDANFERIDYRAAYPIDVSDAEVTQLFQLTFNRDPLVSPERESGFVSGVQGCQVEIDPTTCGPQFPPNQQTSFFGHHKQQHTSDIQPLGIIISDPVLSMHEGQRELSLQLRLEELNSGVLRQPLEQLAAMTEQQDQPQVFRDTLAQVFEILIRNHQRLVKLCKPDLTAEELSKEVSKEQVDQFSKQNMRQRLNSLHRFFLLALLELVEQSSQATECFFRLFGQLICRQALNTGPWLNETEIQRIQTTAKRLLPKSSSSAITVKHLLSLSKAALFYRLFQNTFDLEITTEEGWSPVDRVQINPLLSTNSNALGFTLKCSLSHGSPATAVMSDAIHNEQTLSHPALKISLRAQSNCFPYSILRDFELAEVEVESQVKGLARHDLFTQNGQADPSQSFFPFGAQPNDESYLMIANEELARKKVRELTFHLEWADLPRSNDGFRQHYANYPFNYTNDCFKVSTEVLSAGQWQPMDVSSQNLFEPSIGKLNKCTALKSLLAANAYTPVKVAWPQTAFSPYSNIRNGLFRIKLSAPEVSFGHSEYGPLLTQTLANNAKQKVGRPLPNLPYTPKLTSLKLDYLAVSHIDLHQQGPNTAAQIIQLHPFGHCQVYPSQQLGRNHAPRFLAHYANDSHVCIGIKASNLCGYLNLFFIFAGNARLLSPYPSTDYQWHYLAGDEWIELPPTNLIHDTTQGFLSSGVVTLDIPARIDTQHQIMPDGLYWIKVSTNDGIGRYPDCLHVATHVLQVNGQTSEAGSVAEILPTFSAWKCHPNQAELNPILQLTPRQQAHPQETEQQWLMRVSETLRHKGKAITPWDYEHLILENFPQIASVNCFPCQRFDQQEAAPGSILVTVTGAEETHQSQLYQPRELDSSTLLAIRSKLMSISRHQARIEIRNPGHEIIQVRCRVSFEQGTHHGLALRQLHKKIQNALSPWGHNSLNQGVGWTLSLAKLSAFIQQQDRVSQVSGLSVVKISHNQQVHYTLKDSAVSDDIITPELPWYLLLPARQHSLVATTLPLDSPEPAGIGNIAIGEQFIIAQGADASHPTSASGNRSSQQPVSPAKGN